MSDKELLDKKYYTVSEINEIIHELFNAIPEFKNVSIRGQITNYKGANRSGHYYFSLKDGNSTINAVIFKYDSFKISTNFKNGDDVIVTGELSSYTPSGTYQIIIKDLYLYGKGQLLIQKEELRNKLEAEGLFNPERKLKLPKYPLKVAVVTGKNSAAAEDFRHNLTRRWPLAELKFFTCLVQGVDAPKDIIRALEEAKNSDVDLIILGRGGGSEDDLNAFDDENLVRYIYNLDVPIIAAIGHEINQTFSDFVADGHASTPSAACELAVPSVEEFAGDLLEKKGELLYLIERKISDLELELSQLKSRPVFHNIESQFDLKLQKLEEYKLKFTQIINSKIADLDNKIKNLKVILENASPNKLIEKGYVILKDSKTNKVINKLSQIKKGDELIAQLFDGKVKLIVEDKIDERKED